MSRGNGANGSCAPRAIDQRRAEIERRYKQKKADKPPISLTALRIAELRRLFLARYGRTLPDDDAGRDDVLVMAHHLARRQGDAAKAIRSWIELQAPWMTSTETDVTVAAVLARPLKWRADKLAGRLRLTEAERRRLRICTIGAIDMTKAERKEARKLRQRQRDRVRRRARGAKPRHHYEASSISRAKPWLALGISRATWYRQRRETSPRAL
jgi:hypothetical protein